MSWISIHSVRNQNASKNKASAKSNKKGKILKKSSILAAPVDHDSDCTMGDEESEPSVKALLANMMTMVASLSTQMDEMEGGGRKTRKVVFRGDPLARWMLATAPEMTSQPDPTTTMMSLPPTPPQPHINQERLAPTSLGNQLPPLPAHSHEGPEVTYPDVSPPHLPDVSEAVRAKVTSASFLLMDEDSPTDEEASCQEEEAFNKIRSVENPGYTG